MTSFSPDQYRNSRDGLNKYRECSDKTDKGNKYGTDELKMYMRKQKELRRVRAVQEFEERERVLESKKQRLRELDNKCKQIAGKKLEKKSSSTNSPLSPNNCSRMFSQYHSSSHCPHPTTSRSEKSARSRPNQQSKRSRYDLEAKSSKSSTKLEREAANFIFKEFENIVKRECKNLLKSRHHSLSSSTSATSLVSLTKASVPAITAAPARVVTKVDKNVGTSFTIYEPSPSALPSRIIDSDSQHSDLSSSVIKPVASSRGYHVLVRQRKPYEIPPKKVTVPDHVQHAAASRIQAAYKSYKVRSILSEAKLLPRGSTAAATTPSNSRPTTTVSTASSSNPVFPSTDSFLPKKKSTFYKPRVGAGIGTAEKPYDNISVTYTKKKIPNPILLGVKASPIRPNPEDIPGYIPPPPSYIPLPRPPDLSPRTLPLLRLKTVDEPFPNKQVLDNLDCSQHSLSNTSSPLKLISSISKFQLPSSLAQSGGQHQNSRDVTSNLIRAALRQTVGKITLSKEYGFEEMEKERVRESKINSPGRVLNSEPKEQLNSKSVRKDSRISGDNIIPNFDRENRRRNFEENRNFVGNRGRDFMENRIRNIEENDHRNFEERKLRKEENKCQNFDNKSRNFEETRIRFSEETRLRNLKEGIRNLEENIATSPHAKIRPSRKLETFGKMQIPLPPSLTNGNAHPTPFVDIPMPAFSTVLQEKLRLLREEQEVRTDSVRVKTKSPSKRSLTAVSKATEQIKKKIIEAKQILEDYKMELLRSSSASNMSHGDDRDPTYESDFDSESVLSQSQHQQNSLFGHDSEILSSLGMDLDRNIEAIPKPREKVVVEGPERKSAESSERSSIQRSKDNSLESYREPCGRGTKSPMVLQEVNGDAFISEKPHPEPVHFKTSELSAAVLVEEEASDDTEYEEIVETVSRASSNLPTEDVVYETDFDTDLQSSLSKRHRGSVGASQKDFSLMVDLEDKEATQDSFSISTGTDPVDLRQEQSSVGPRLGTVSKIDQASQIAKEVLELSGKTSEISSQSVSEKLAKSLEFSENLVKSLSQNQKSLENSELLQSSEISENLQKSLTNSEDLLRSSPLPNLHKSVGITTDLVKSEVSEEKSLDISQKSLEMSEDLPVSKLSISEAKISPKSDDFVSENLPKSTETSNLKSISEKMPRSEDIVSETLPKSVEASFPTSIIEKIDKSEISPAVQQPMQILEDLPGSISERMVPPVAVTDEDKFETNASISGISLASNVITDIGYEDFDTDIESQSLADPKIEEKIPSSIAIDEPMSTNEPKESSTTQTDEQLSKQSKPEDSVQPSFLSEQEESKIQPDEDISGKIIEEFSSMSEASNIVEDLLDTESIKPEILLEKPTELPPSEISSVKPDRASPLSPKKLELAPVTQYSDMSGISEVLPPSKSPEDFDPKTENQPSESSQISQQSSLLLSQHSQTEEPEPEKSPEIALPKSVQKEVSTQSDSFLTEISNTEQKPEESIKEKLSRDNFSQSEISLNLPSSDSEVQTSESVFGQNAEKVSEHAKLTVTVNDSEDNFDNVANSIKDIVNENVPQDIPENVSATESEIAAAHDKTNQITSKIEPLPHMSTEASEAEFLETLTKTVDPDIIDKIESLIASEISKQMEQEDSSEGSQATAVEDSRYSSYVSNFHVEDVVYESDFDTDVQSDRSDQSKSKHSSLLESAVKKEVEIMVQNGDLKMEIKTGEGDFVVSRPSTPEDPRIRRILDDKILLDSLVSRIISRMLKEVSKARNEAFKDPVSSKGQSVPEPAESEGSSVQGEVDADAEWFEDDLMSANAAADDESLKREAAEIVAEQLRIENEIRALEALQAQVPATLLNLSDIPDKPPPPYSPPSSDSLSFSVRSFAVQTSLKELKDLINARVDQIWSHYTQKGDIPPLEESLEGPIQAQNESSEDTAQVPTTTSDTDPSMTSTRAFNSLLHNLVQDTIMEVLLIEESGPTAQDFIDKIRPGSLALEAQKMRVPRSKDSLRSVVYSKVKNLLPFTVLANHPPAPRKRLTKWTSRPRDLVDEVLAEELIDEDREWTESWPEEILVLDRWAEKFARKALGEVVLNFKTAFT